MKQKIILSLTNFINNNIFLQEWPAELKFINEQIQEISEIKVGFYGGKDILK